jgi:hypothetical protein
MNRAKWNERMKCGDICGVKFLSLSGNHGDSGIDRLAQVVTV